MNRKQGQEYRLPHAYPEVTGARPDVAYAKALQSGCSGMASECTAMMQLRYHSLHAQQAGEDEIAKMLVEIARVDSDHMQLLGQTILALGVDPAYCVSIQGAVAYWNGSFADRGKDLSIALQRDIALKNEMIEKYEGFIQSGRDARVRLLLQRLQQEEYLHLDALGDALRGLQGK